SGEAAERPAQPEVPVEEPDELRLAPSALGADDAHERGLLRGGPALEVRKRPQDRGPAQERLQLLLREPSPPAEVERRGDLLGAFPLAALAIRAEAAGEVGARDEPDLPQRELADHVAAIAVRRPVDVLRRQLAQRGEARAVSRAAAHPRRLAREERA